jgi:hypothetical protein
MAVPRPEPLPAAHTPRLLAPLPRGERLGHAARIRLASEIVAAYAHARGALRRDAITAVVAGLRAQSPPARHPSAATREEAHRLARAVTRTLRHMPGDTRCLVRSLVLIRLLARRGIPAQLVIGARTAPDFLAHAWVEHAGEPVLDPGEDSFGRLVEL